MKVYDCREDLIRNCIPKNTVGCEVGIYAGEFAEFLYRTLSPTRFYLIDGWDLCGETLFCANQDGNGGCSLPATLLYQTVVDRFSMDPRVHVWKGLSNDKIPDIPDNSLDWIYIDADHSYEGCLRDLELSLPKLKPNGLLMGHDYEINKKKCIPNWNFGVGQAVDTFLTRYPKHRMIAKGMDGCVSFCIQLNAVDSNHHDVELDNRESS